MNVLIVGGSNLLGRYLLRSVPSGLDVTATWYTNYMPGCTYQLDLTNQSQVNYVFGRVKPQVVLHLAAIGDVDFAEAHFQETFAVNVLGPRNVLHACQDYHAKIIYTSSNAVFDGKNPPYAEDAPRYPVNGYGVTRKEAEDSVMQSGCDWVLLRLFLLYGWSPPGARTNWVQTIVRKLRAGEGLSLVDDTVWQPTYAGFAADAIWKAAQAMWLAGDARIANQVIHLASPEPVSLYTLGLNVAHTWDLPADKIQPIKSSSLPKSLAKRPTNSTYNLEKSHQLGLALPSLWDGLKQMKADENELAGAH